MKLYTELASWWPVMSSPADYQEEAGLYKDILVKYSSNIKTVLELGSGGGNNASHLKAHFKLTLVDKAPGMVEVSKKLNPECEHHVGDMRDARLDREFDAVFIHDAVNYITTEPDLSKVFETAYIHSKKGGCTLILPDHFRETFHPSTKHGGHDSGNRSLRYLEWEYDPDPDDTETVTDFAFLLKEGNQAPKVVYDRHISGLFPRDTWVRLLEKAGFKVSLEEVKHSELPPGTYFGLAGVK